MAETNSTKLNCSNEDDTFAFVLACHLTNTMQLPAQQDWMALSTTVAWLQPSLLLVLSPDPCRACTLPPPAEESGDETTL